MTINTSGRQSAVALLAIASVCYAGTAISEEAAKKSESQQRAADLLSGMTHYLAGLPQFKVNLIASYDAVQESGQKIEFNEMRKVTALRPNLLRVEQQKSDGAQDLLVFDGKEINLFHSKLGVYAKAPQPGSIDDAVVYFVRDLGMRLPLATMFSTRLPEELSKRVKSIDYVELTDILGLPAHHIAASGNTVDIQAWIADGEQPLPLRIVLTYKTEPGQPQFRALFLDWDVKSPAASDAFRFVPPADAKQIIFAVQAPPAAGDPAAATSGPAGDKP